MIAAVFATVVAVVVVAATLIDARIDARPVNTAGRNSRHSRRSNRHNRRNSHHSRRSRHNSRAGGPSRGQGQHRNPSRPSARCARASRRSSDHRRRSSDHRRRSNACRPHSNGQRHRSVAKPDSRARGCALRPWQRAWACCLPTPDSRIGPSGAPTDGTASEVSTTSAPMPERAMRMKRKTSLRLSMIQINAPPRSSFPTALRFNSNRVHDVYGAMQTSRHSLVAAG